MCPISYYNMSRQFTDPRQVRLAMVRFAKEKGIKPAARAFSSTAKTVRKWLRRWVPGSMEGLQEQSRAPKNVRKRITAQQRQQVIHLKRQLPSWGSARMKRDFSLSLSEKAIRKIWHHEGLMRKKRRKHKTKNDLRQVKAAWKLFQQTCMDTKDLIDIPEIWTAVQLGHVPKVQYTAREVVSGLQFIAFADERSLSYANLFAHRILDHLRSCGANLSECTIQTDNGSEFIGNWTADHDSIFTKTVEAAGLTHRTIPPAAHSYQADVETVHRIIEDELYEVEAFRSRNEFLSKTSAYNLWFNVARKNSYKNFRTPWEIIHERDPNVSPRIAALPPVFLDQLFFQRLKHTPPGGYDVIPHPSPRSDNFVNLYVLAPWWLLDFRIGQARA